MGREIKRLSSSREKEREREIEIYNISYFQRVLTWCFTSLKLEIIKSPIH